MTSLPTVLSGLRLLAGPVFLAFGTVPASVSQLGLLLAVVLTDVADSFLARHLGAISRFGAAMDTTADKVFVVTLLVKLMVAGHAPSWIVYVILVQFVILAVEGSVFVYRFGRVPIPDMVAKSGTLLAFITVVVGIAVPVKLLIVVLGSLTIAANALHLVTAFLRITSESGELPRVIRRQISSRGAGSTSREELAPDQCEDQSAGQEDRRSPTR